MTMIVNNIVDTDTENAKKHNDLSNRLQLVQEELTRCADMARQAQRSQSNNANTLAHILLENTTQPALQENLSTQALHRVRKLKVDQQQLRAELTHQTELLSQDQNSPSAQQTKQRALYAYLAHKKRNAAKDHHPCSRKRQKLS